jgi:murein DD-endopeptidase MepM/ murein hydrolase activator NlpD
MRDYKTLSLQKPQLIQTQKERSETQRELSNLVLRVEEVSQQLQGLLDLDRKLRTVANLEERKSDKNILAMGGSDQRTSVVHKYPGQQKAYRSETIQFQEVPDTASSVTSEHEEDMPRFLETHTFASFLLPGQHPVKGFIRSSFGRRVSPGGEAREFNGGIDISTRAKAPVVAPFAGLVASCRRDATQGWVLSLTHGHGLVTLYGRLERIFVREGQYVERGERIGMVGQGNQKGPHLHFEIHLNDLAVNPVLYLSRGSFDNLARLGS